MNAIFLQISCQSFTESHPSFVFIICGFFVRHLSAPSWRIFYLRHLRASFTSIMTCLHLSWVSAAENDVVRVENTVYSIQIGPVGALESCIKFTFTSKQIYWRGSDLGLKDIMFYIWFTLICVTFIAGGH